MVVPCVIVSRTTSMSYKVSIRVALFYREAVGYVRLGGSLSWRTRSYCSRAGWTRPPRWPSRRRRGFACHALSFDYGQRHRFELDGAARRGRGAGGGGAPDRPAGPVGRRAALAHSALTDDIARAQGPPRRAGRGHPRHLRAGPQHDLPGRGPGLRRGDRRVRHLHRASTPSTTAAIPTAGRSSSRRSSGWPTWPRPPRSRARAGTRIHAPLIRMTKARDHPPRDWRWAWTTA